MNLMLTKLKEDLFLKKHGLKEVIIQNGLSDLVEMVFSNVTTKKSRYISDILIHPWNWGASGCCLNEVGMIVPAPSWSARIPINRKGTINQHPQN